jgi:hypothetical protein
MIYHCFNLCLIAGPGMQLLPGKKRELGVMLGPLSFERQETMEGKW